MSRIDDLQNLIAAKQRHLQKLRERQAQLSIGTPPELETEFEDVEAELARLQPESAGPAPLPHGSRMPLKRNPLFVGRGEDLQWLARVLQAGDTAATGQIAAVTGMGGIGKTQLAIEFVHRYGRYFAGGVFWLSFADPAGVSTEVALCGGRGSLDLAPNFGSLPLEDQVRLVLLAWQSPLPRLLVFDNCEDEGLLTQWRPPTGGCRVLITSRRQTWSKILAVQTLPLDVLRRVESIDLLRKFRPGLVADEPDLNQIAEEVCDLPLALHLAGSYLETCAEDPLFGSPGNFLTELRSVQPLSHKALQGIDATQRSPTNRILHAARTFVLSYGRLLPGDSADRTAVALLHRAAFFAREESIPRKLLIATLHPKEGDREEADLVSRGMQRLMKLGLVEQEEEGAVRVHRLVADFVRGVMVDAEAQANVEDTLLAEAQCLNQTGLPAPLLTWQVHLRAVTETALVREDERAATLCANLGDHLQMLGNYAAACLYYVRSLAIREKVLGPDHPDTAAGLNNLVYLLNALSDLAAVRPYYERALAIREKVLEPDQPNLVQSLNNLALLVKDRGDLAGARLLIERTLAIWEKVLGPDHPSTAVGLNNLARLLQDQGDLAGARLLFERALTIWEKVLGSDHPYTAVSLNNLALLLQDKGDLAAARPLFERALAVREKVLGPDHPDTARSRNNLVALTVATGETDQ